MSARNVHTSTSDSYPTSLSKKSALLWYEKKYFVRSAKIFNIDHPKNISLICQLHLRNQKRRTFLIKLNNLRVLELHEVWILYEEADVLLVPKIPQALMFQ